MSWSVRFASLRDRQFDLPGESTVLTCDTCGVWRVWPVPQDLALHYPDEYGPHRGRERRYIKRPWHRAWGMSFSGVGQLRRLARWLLQFNSAATELWTYLDHAPSAIFDYGCGSGHFLGAASQLRIRVAGMDVSEHAVAEARRSGIDCVVGSHEDLSRVDGTFDLIRLWHVLEHVADPVAALSDLRSLLEPGGRLVVAVPNTHSALADLFGEDWYQLDAPRHLWGFDESSLGRALAAAGFVVERVVHNGDAAALYRSLGYRLQGVGSDANLPVEPAQRALAGLSVLADAWNAQRRGDSIVVVASAPSAD